MIVIGALWFGYYTISPLFINIKVDEALPESSQTEESQQTTEPKELARAEVIGNTLHPASGTVRLVEADGKTYVRYENFKTINGPDIYVYLSKDLDATDFVSLGRVRATEGNINYEIPADVDPSEYRYILT